MEEQLDLRFLEFPLVVCAVSLQKLHLQKTNATAQFSFPIWTQSNTMRDLRWLPETSAGWNCDIMWKQRIYGLKDVVACTHRPLKKQGKRYQENSLDSTWWIIPGYTGCVRLLMSPKMAKKTIPCSETQVSPEGINDTLLSEIIVGSWIPNYIQILDDKYSRISILVCIHTKNQKNINFFCCGSDDVVAIYIRGLHGSKKLDLSRCYQILINIFFLNRDPVRKLAEDNQTQSKMEHNRSGLASQVLMCKSISDLLPETRGNYNRPGLWDKARFRTQIHSGLRSDLRFWGLGGPVKTSSLHREKPDFVFSFSYTSIRGSNLYHSRYAVREDTDVLEYEEVNKQ